MFARFCWLRSVTQAMRRHTLVFFTRCETPWYSSWWEGLPDPVAFRCNLHWGGYHLQHGQTQLTQKGRFGANFERCAISASKEEKLRPPWGSSSANWKTHISTSNGLNPQRAAEKVFGFARKLHHCLSLLPLVTLLICSCARGSQQIRDRK